MKNATLAAAAILPMRSPRQAREDPRSGPRSRHRDDLSAGLPRWARAPDFSS